MRKQLMQAERLTAVEKLSQELSWKKYATLSQGQREHLQSLAQEIDDQKRLQQQAEDTAKWLEEGRTAQAKSLQDLQEEYKKAAREVETFGLSRGQIAERDLQLLQEQIDTERALNAEIGVGGSQYLSHLEQQLALRQQIVVETEKLDTLDAGKQAAEEAAAAFSKTAEAAQKTNDAITQGLTDALMRGFESGKGFAENLRDTTVNMFKTMVLTPAIQGVLAPVVGGVQNMVGNAASSAATSMFGSAFGGGLAAAGGMTGLGATFQAGMGLSLSQAAAASSAYSAAGMGASGAALTAGAYFPPAMAAAAWMALMDGQLSRGWGGDNNAAGYGLTWATGGLNVVADRLFGRGQTNADATGISGTFTADGLTNGQKWQDYSQKGGAFKSDRRWTDSEAIDSATADLLAGQITGLTQTARTVAKVMGESITEGIQTWKYDFSLQLSDNGDLSEAADKIAGEVDRAADALAEHLFPSLASLTLEGETAGEAMTRLGETFAATNSAALLLGRDWQTAFGGLGIASAEARQQLVDMAGGVGALQAKMGTYYDSFFSDSEKNTKSLQLLDAQFAAMGVRLDLSKESFRAYLEDSTKVDLATESGRKLYAAMLDLAGPFSQLVDSLGDAADGKTIGSLASLMGEKSPIAESVKEAAADWWSQYGTAVEDQADQAAQIKAGLDNMAAAFASMKDALLTAMQQTQSAALLSNSQSAASVANVIEVGISRMTGVVEGALSSGNRW